MAKKQSRRSISLRGATYTAIRLDCAARDLSLSDYIEQLIADDRHDRGLPRVARPIDAVIERVVARQPLPSESAIKAGPPVEQLKLIERQPTLKTDGGLSKASGMRSPSKSRAWDDSHLLPAHQAAAKKAAAQQRQVIPEGTKAPSRGMVGRPTGARVAPAPKVASGAALELAVKVDAVAALHGGRAGMVGF